VNYESAVQNFKLAANGDNAEGLYYLAISLQYGLGVLEDCNTAVELYKKAAQHGDLKLDYQVALSYVEEGDYDRALLIYEKLAERGQEVGQSNAAWIYDANLQSSKFGNHEKDINSVFALKYYRRSADQGNSISHLKLGDYYYFGKGGLSVDYTKAVHYYTYISGVNAQAKFNLGYMHHHGEGMTKDLFLAKRFYDDSLLANPNSYIPVKLCLLFLGLDYAVDQLQKGNYFLLLEQARDYFVPEVIFTGFTDPKVASSNEKNSATSTTAVKSENGKGNNPASLEPSIWDTETLFGYNFDTVVIFTLGIVLFVSLLIRYQIIQFQV
jgi:TPR repeat protein